MVISFSKKHSILLLLALIVFSLVLYFFISSLADTKERALSSNADISEVSRTPVANYEEAVSSLKTKWQTAWNQAEDKEARIQTVEEFQTGLQEIVIERTDQDLHLELILALSQLKRALQDSDQGRVEDIVNSLFSN